MPSPVAHSLIGLAVAAQFFIRPGRLSTIREQLRKNAGICVAGVVMANLPDVDYVPGVLAGDINAYHHYFTHSLGWVGLTAGAAWLVWKIIKPAAGWLEFVFLFVAAASHLAADLVTDDGRPPYGILALWPWSSEFIQSPVTLFWRLEKSNWSDVLQWHNVWAVSTELAICVPLLFLVLFFKVRAGPEMKRA